MFTYLTKEYDYFRKSDRMKYTINDLKNIIIKLRSPNGCPWDRVQTHESMKRAMIEETYEALEALENQDDKAFSNELGDCLLQIVFHAQIAEERGAFDFDDVVSEICQKLIDRHTHVFGKDLANNETEALDVWEKSKKKEKALKSFTDTLLDVPSNFPSLIRAEKVQKKAKNCGFDWKDIKGAREKVYEELEEINDAKTQEEIEEEYGDFLFAAVNMGRFLKVDSEMALRDATEKFIDRFSKMEQLSKKKGKELDELTLDEMDNLWNEIKENVKKE